MRTLKTVQLVHVIVSNQAVLLRGMCACCLFRPKAALKGHDDAARMSTARSTLGKLYVWFCIKFWCLHIQKPIVANVFFFFLATLAFGYVIPYVIISQS